jgi:hypothetical protein
MINLKDTSWEIKVEKYNIDLAGANERDTSLD